MHGCPGGAWLTLQEPQTTLQRYYAAAMPLPAMLNRLFLHFSACVMPMQALMRSAASAARSLPRGVWLLQPAAACRSVTAGVIGLIPAMSSTRVAGTSKVILWLWKSMQSPLLPLRCSRKHC